jgi:hypothetical protein
LLSSLWVQQGLQHGFAMLWVFVLPLESKYGNCSPYSVWKGGGQMIGLARGSEVSAFHVPCELVVESFRIRSSVEVIDLGVLKLVWIKAIGSFYFVEEGHHMRCFQIWAPGF